MNSSTVLVRYKLCDKHLNSSLAELLLDVCASASNLGSGEFVTALQLALIMQNSHIA